MSRRGKVPATRSPYKSTHVGGAEITVGDEATNAVTVTIQLQDQNLDDLTDKGAVHFYLSDDAAGNGLIATAHSSGMAVGTDGLAVEFTADKLGLLVSEDDGDIDLVFTEAGAKTAYLCLVMPDGSVVISDPIVHA